MMSSRNRPIRRVLVAGASGKLGRRLLPRLLGEGYQVRALVHKRPVKLPGVECVRGSVSDLTTVLRAAEGAEAICQLATTKEDPDSFLDVSIRGTWNLLEAGRQSKTLRRWILTGGDAAMGIYFLPQPCPINEAMPHRAYPGVYAFSKVLEEVMGQQYHVQYGLPYTCLRCSWILDNDDIVRHLAFGGRNQNWGIPHWPKHLSAAQRRAVRDGRERAAIGLHEGGRPIIRHVVHVADVVEAFLLALANPQAAGQTFNIAAPAAFAYDQAAKHLSSRTGWPTMPIKVPGVEDFQIDISKACSILGYQPQYDIFRTIDEALKTR